MTTTNAGPAGQGNGTTDPQAGGNPPADPKGAGNGGTGMTDREAALLKEVMEQKRQLATLTGQLDQRNKQDVAAKEKELAEQGKYKELVETKDKELVLERQRRIFAEVRAEAVSQGVDPRYTKLIALDGITFSDNGTLLGLDTALTSLKADFPEAFATKAHVPGTPKPGSPAGGGSGFQSWDEFCKAPSDERTKFRTSQPEAYNRLLEKAKTGG